MAMHIKALFTSGVLSSLCLIAANCAATAQIVPDRTLPTNSRVNQQGKNNLIEGGTVRGNNLFHSFQKFTIPTGTSAYIDNSLNIQNIFGRVTGGSISSIDGRLRANGTANLFLLNPNGIIFGPNASLSLGGSFLATTADLVLFTDGSRFTVSNPQTPPLLTIAVPVGLGIGSTPGSISVQGRGKELGFANPKTPIGSPIVGTGLGLTGLKTAPGKSLALIGGPVQFNGGVLTAPSGQIELGSVAGGKVGFSLTPAGFLFNYDNASGFQDVVLNKQALLDASGVFNGRINIQSKNLYSNDASLVIVSNFGNFPSGKISINATDSVIFSGLKSIPSLTSPSNVVPFGGVYVQNFSIGKGADIAISAKNLTLKDFTNIDSFSYGQGKGGDITINTQDTLSILGQPPVKFKFFPSAISTFTAVDDTAKNIQLAGDIQLSGKRLSIQDGGLLLSQTFGSGDGGNITANFTDGIEIAGGFPLDPIFNSFNPSVLGTTTVSFGNAGNVNVTTRQLNLKDGGRVNATTTASGSAGNITIDALEGVNVKGRIPKSTGNNTVNSSQIVSSTEFANPIFTKLFKPPAVLRGITGDVNIKTPNLTIQDGGLVNVDNEGIGRGGNINVDSFSVSLNNFGRITASTAGGNGGNINILNSDLLLMRRKSEISATAGGTGEGGNVTINSDLLTALEDSDITANAFQGKGGTIKINTQGLFNSPDSNISATSERGPEFSGVVNLNVSQLEFSRSTAQPVSGPQSPEIATACSDGIATKEASLVNAGPGGLPPGPLESLNPEAEWRGHQPQKPHSVPQPLDSVELDEMPEVQGWLPNGDGTVRLVARTHEGVLQAAASTSACR